MTECVLCGNQVKKSSIINQPYNVCFTCWFKSSLCSKNKRKINYSFVFRISGMISMILGWIFFHFLNLVFDESLKFVVLGITLLLFSFSFKDEQNIWSVVE